jgi:two-component system invasion response regulator UvrY
MLSVLIVDDHAIVRQGLKQLLLDEFHSVTFGEAGESAEALSHFEHRSWDVLILDIFLPGRNGLDLLKEIRGIAPKLPVLVYSMHPEDQFAVRALKLGASGYISKSNLPEELVKAVRKLLAGGKYISPALAEHLAFDIVEGTVPQPHELLSEREFQVMQMIAAGKSTSEIAAELSLSAKTISTYRARLLEKMHIKTNADIIHYVIEHNIGLESMPR